MVRQARQKTSCIQGKRRKRDVGAGSVTSLVSANARASAATSRHRSPRPLRSLSSFARVIVTRRFSWALGNAFPVSITLLSGGVQVHEHQYQQGGNAAGNRQGRLRPDCRNRKRQGDGGAKTTPYGIAATRAVGPCRFPLGSSRGFHCAIMSRPTISVRIGMTRASAGHSDGLHALAAPHCSSGL